MPARPKNRSLAYLRRSSGKQEASLESQLTWAIDESTKLGVKLDASLADLEHMLRIGKYSYKGIRLDDAITGADMMRPGFLAVRDDILRDRSFSHLFIHMRDRFGRPEEAMPMAMMEKAIRQNGVTLILSNGIGLPLELGCSDLGEDLKVLVEYYMSGDYLRKLAERIITSQRNTAKKGYWTGGEAPWGFIRVLVSPEGAVLEELVSGRTVKQDGCHVQLRPKEQAKLRWWIYMLDLAFAGWGSKRIANALNEFGVPSPDAGKIRRDRGVPHVNDGKWNHRSVLELLRNPAIIGKLRYGRRSMGAHRRLSNDGYRLVNDTDRTASNKPRVIRNAPELCIEEDGGYESLYDVEKWNQIQAKLTKRGECQDAIPRVKDLAKYPLSCHVIDMTNDCGSLMYARTSGDRKLYVCGRYIKHGPTACDNNEVDAEALLTMVLRKIERLSGAGNLESRIRALLQERSARQSDGSIDAQRDLERHSQTSRLAQLQTEKATVVRRMRAADDSLYEDLKKEREEVAAEIASLEMLLAHRPTDRAADTEPEHQIEAALTLLQRFRRIATEPEARNEIPGMVDALGLRIGLNFREAIKGKKRTVRKLEGGILAFGDAPLPVELHGRDHADRHASADRMICTDVPSVPTEDITEAKSDIKKKAATGEKRPRRQKRNP